MIPVSGYCFWFPGKWGLWEEWPWHTSCFSLQAFGTWTREWECWLSLSCSASPMNKGKTKQLHWRLLSSGCWLTQVRCQPRTSGSQKILLLMSCFPAFLIIIIFLIECCFCKYIYGNILILRYSYIPLEVISICFSLFILTHLCSRGHRERRQAHRDCLSADSFSKWPQRPSLDQTKARSQKFSLGIQYGCRGPWTWTIPAEGCWRLLIPHYAQYLPIEGVVLRN